MWGGVVYLAIRGAVRFNDPTGFVAESFEDFVVVAVLRKLVVPVHPQTGEDLRRYGSPPPLSPLVVLSLLPRRLPRPRRHPRRRRKKLAGKPDRLNLIDRGEEIKLSGSKRQHHHHHHHLRFRRGTTAAVGEDESEVWLTVIWVDLSAWDGDVSGGACSLGKRARVLKEKLLHKTSFGQKARVRKGNALNTLRQVNRAWFSRYLLLCHWG